MIFLLILSFAAMIRTAARIDRERLLRHTAQAWINVTLVARDRGFPTMKTSRLEIRMHVDDVNDNSPRFETFSYDVCVSCSCDVIIYILRLDLFS